MENLHFKPKIYTPNQSKAMKMKLAHEKFSVILDEEPK